MSNHSIIEHRAYYHYIRLEEDYLAICSHGECSPHCKALILAILESWTNNKREKGEGDYIYLTMPQWIKYTYMLYERNIITDCIKELLKEGLITRRQITMFEQKTFEYKLMDKVINERIKALPSKESKEVLPRLDAYLAYRNTAKERAKVKRAEKREKEGVRDFSRTVGDNSPTHDLDEEVREKSITVREKSQGVGDNSTEGYVINQRNLESITNLPLTSTQEDTVVLPSGENNDTPTNKTDCVEAVEEIEPPTKDIPLVAHQENTPSESLPQAQEMPLSTQAVKDLSNQATEQPQQQTSSDDHIATGTIEILEPDLYTEQPFKDRLVEAKRNGRKINPVNEQVKWFYDTFTALGVEFFGLETFKADYFYGKSNPTYQLVTTYISEGVSPCDVRMAFEHMWNEEKGGKYFWQNPDTLTTRAFCNNFRAKLLGAKFKKKQEERKQRQDNSLDNSTPATTNSMDELIMAVRRSAGEI
jgi:hypothetical protein